MGPWIVTKHDAQQQPGPPPSRTTSGKQQAAALFLSCSELLMKRSTETEEAREILRDRRPAARTRGVPYAKLSRMEPHALASLLAFCPVAALLTVTPGLDTALVLRTSASEGARPALAAGLGICLGCLAWAAIVALGLGALLAASELAYGVLRWVGAAYLIQLGVKLLLKPRTALEASGAESERLGAAAWLARGLLTNLLNPKIGVFYVSFLPQFVPVDTPVGRFTLLLGAIHALMGLLWFALLVLATQPVARALRCPAVIVWLDRLTGGVFVAFGARLALESRR